MCCGVRLHLLTTLLVCFIIVDQIFSCTCSIGPPLPQSTAANFNNHLFACFNGTLFIRTLTSMKQSGLSLWNIFLFTSSCDAHFMQHFGLMSPFVCVFLSHTYNTLRAVIHLLQLIYSCFKCRILLYTCSALKLVINE